MTSLSVGTRPRQPAELGIRYASSLRKEESMMIVSVELGTTRGLPESFSAELYSPNYPLEYPSHTNVAWLLRTPRGSDSRILFRVTDVDLERCCDDLTVYDGGGFNAAVLAMVTGSVAGNNSYVSGGDSLMVRLRTDCSVSGRGFRGQATLVPALPLAAWSRSMLVGPMTRGTVMAEVIVQNNGASRQCVQFSVFASPDLQMKWSLTLSTVGGYTRKTAEKGERKERTAPTCRHPRPFNGLYLFDVFVVLISLTK